MRFSSIPQCWLVPIMVAAVFLATWLSARPGWGGPGLTWDEAYYYPTFVDVAQWSGELFTAPARALSSEGLRRGWEEIHELPPVVKWLGAGATALASSSGWGALWGLRLVPAAAFAAAVALLFLIGRRLGGSLAGGAAAAVYILLPRVFGHAQIAATETVFAAITALVLWTALHDLSRWRWRVLLALALGIALAAKVNGVILFLMVVFWLVTRQAANRRLRIFSLKSDGLALVVLLVAAPLLCLAIWPWMWDETAARLHEYYLFVREHFHQGLWYLGERWNFRSQLAPPSYPFVIAHLTAPAWSIVLFWVGFLSVLVLAIRRFALRPPMYLLLLATAAPIAASSLPGTPKYDGIRLFFPFFLPAALIAVLGCRRLLVSIRPDLGRKLRMPPWAAMLLPAAAALIQALLLRPTIDYYHWPARLAAGGEAIFPFEQTYWGNALDRNVVEDLNEFLPPGARVKTLALQGATFDILKDWGVLREDIHFNGQPPYDFHLMQNRRGFWGNAEWSIYGRTPLRKWGSGAGGEALIFLYDGRPPGAAPAP